MADAKEEEPKVSEPVLTKPAIPFISLSAPGAMPAFLRDRSAAPMPGMTRQVSVTRQATGVVNGGPDWRSFLSIEERTGIRNRLREVYTKHCDSYKSLLDLVVAIDEELVFQSATTRLDYFKTGIDWDTRLQLKRKQLKGDVGVGTLGKKPTESEEEDEGEDEEEGEKSTRKRVKTH